jgi:hypothetical protein
VTESRYVFDNAVTAETGLRFAGLEATFDPSTIRYLSGVGVCSRLRRRNTTPFEFVHPACLDFIAHRPSS